MTRIPPWYVKACRECGIQEEDIEKFLHSPFYNEFYKQVIGVNGLHILLMGQTMSGKSQKLRHLLKWIAPKETIIYFDTGKPGDMELMLTLGRPVQILIPYGCKIELRGKLPCEVQITPVFAPDLYWQEIKKGWVNIISVINFFLVEDNHRKYIRQMYHNYLLDARTGKHAHFTPSTTAADESQSILGSGRVKASQEAKITGQDVANIMRQIRACNERWAIASQSYYDIIGGARENAPCFVVCRGTKVERRDHSVLSYLSGFAESCECREGWVVMPNGRYFDRQDSLKFPLYEVPNIRVIYYPTFVDVEELGKEEEDSLTSDLGVYAAMALPRDMDELMPSISEMPAPKESELIPALLEKFEMPESWKEKTEEKMIES